MKILLLLASITVCGLLPSSTWALPSLPDTYDAAIEKSVKRWWPDLPDARWWKAQLYQESLLDTSAVSPVGARGLAQFMPGTWADVSRRLNIPHGVSPHEARFAIEAGAYYMAVLRREWHLNRPALDRQRLAQASYNAGLGNVLGAQRACDNARHWPQIAPCLSHVTGRHANETLTYVVRIARWHAQLVAEGRR